MKCVLIDDERLAVEHLKQLILKTGSVAEKDLILYTNPMDAIRGIEQHQPDVVFTDIEMPMVSGLTLTARIKECCPEAEVVFVTAHKQYAVEAFEQYALDYLLKPLVLERVRKTVQRVETRLKEKSLAYKSVEPEVVITLMGDVTVRKRGEVLDFKWRSGKVREVFAFLLHNRHRNVPKLEMIESLWPGEEAEKSHSSLNMVLYRLRNRITQYELPLTIQFLDESYQMMVDDEVFIDLDRWEKHLKENPLVSEENLKECLRYLSMVKGTYMKNQDYPWIVEMRKRFEESYAARLKKVGEYFLVNGNYEEAVDFYKKVHRMAPMDVEASRKLLVLYRVMGKKNAVRQLYQEIQKAYQKIECPVPSEILSVFSEVPETKTREP